MIAIWFKEGTQVGAKLLQVGLMGKWNHVGIEVDGMIYDATFKDGVAVRSIDSFCKHSKNVEAITVDLPSEEEAIKFLMNQVGKPYDWKAICAFPFRKTWNDYDAWFCSELGAEFLKKGGIRMRLDSNRVTPRDLYLAMP